MLSGGLYASCFFFFVLVILDFGFVWDLEFGIWDFSDNIRVIWLVLFIIGYALPRDMGKLRFKVGPSSAVILEIYKLPSSSLKSFTAEATALLSNFNTGCAARFTVKSKSARASATSLLRTTSISCLVFRGAILILFNLTFISIIVSIGYMLFRRRLGISHLGGFLLLGTRFNLALHFSSVPAEFGGGREFPQFVAHHIFANVYRHKFLAVMHAKRVPHHFLGNG